jgi:hypothetical protein
MSSLERAWKGTKGTAIAWGMGVALFAFSCWQNFDLVFRQYDEQYRFFSLNSKEMGEIVHDFLDDGNTMEQVFVLEYLTGWICLVRNCGSQVDPFINVRPARH